MNHGFYRVIYIQTLNIAGKIIAEGMSKIAALSLMDLERGKAEGLTNRGRLV